MKSTKVVLVGALLLHSEKFSRKEKKHTLTV